MGTSRSGAATYRPLVRYNLIRLQAAARIAAGILAGGIPNGGRGTPDAIAERAVAILDELEARVRVECAPVPLMDRRGLHKKKGAGRDGVLERPAS